VQSAEGTLRDELADVNSLVPIGGVPAALLRHNFGDDDYTIINPDVERLAANARSLTHTMIPLITGDSLSFNGFGYTEFSVDGGGYATAQPFGMSSWSHLIRDLWFTSNGGFSGIKDLAISGTATRFFSTSSTTFRHLGMNTRAAFYNFANTTQTLSVTTNYSGKGALVISFAPAADAVLFDVDGVEYDNESPNGTNQGYGYMLVPFGTITPVIDNVRKKSDGTAGGFWLYGITSNNTVTPRITGKGAYTSGQILAEYSTLVAPFSPDAIYYIIGANDIGASVALSTFKSNLEQFINNARAAKPDCIIILISSVPSSTASLNRVKTKTYIRVMREVALEKDCSLIDLYSKLEKTDPSYWRFDNIHFNAKGDDLVFNIIKGLTLNQLEINDDKFTPSRATYLGINGRWLNAPVSGSASSANAQTVVIQFGAGAPAVLASSSSNTAFANSLTLSYVADGGSDKARVVCPSTHAIGTVSDIVIGSDLTERVVGRFITSKISMDFARVNSAGRQTIAGSGLFAVITFAPAT